MNRTITVAETAALVRAALKAEFPTVKFSVRKDGACIRVAYSADLDVRTVDAVARRFEGSTFDGMTDSETARTITLADGSTAYSICRFVFVDRVAA